MNVLTILQLVFSGGMILCLIADIVLKRLLKGVDDAEDEAACCAYPEDDIFDDM